MAVGALYLHIPFCHARCAYCDFETRALTGSALDGARDRYLAPMWRRVDALGAAGALQDVQTVYIGGGTPSVMGEHLPLLVCKVLRWCEPHEVTCEANPESFSEPLADALAQAGVTRVSLGVQSLDDAELAASGRIHTATVALEALRRARRYGFSVSCDVMCGLPHQTEESWQRTVEGVLASHIDHLSVYPLILEEGTPLAARAERDPSLVPDEDMQAIGMEFARGACKRAGLMPYEVASYARPGKVCRHNCAYWQGVSYIGVGRSAAGMVSRDEWDALAAFFPGAQVPDDAYRIRMVQRDDEARQFEFEYLTEREAMAEDLMLGMRMTAGVGPALYAHAHDVLGAALDDAMATARDEGLARFDEASASFVPTERGWLMGNELYGLMWGLADVLS